MEILSREVSKDGDNFVVVENIKKVYSVNDILNEIQNIQRQKLHYIEQNKRMKQEYDSLFLKEMELQDMLNQMPNNDFEEIS